MDKFNKLKVKLKQMRNNESTSESKKSNLNKVSLFIPLILFILIISSFFTIFFLNHKKVTISTQTVSNEQDSSNMNMNKNISLDDKEITITPTPTIDLEEEKRQQEALDLIKKADLLALGYDYEGAIHLIKSFQYNYKNYDTLTAAVLGYEKKQKELVPYGAYDSVDSINHIFFHTLVADVNKAFDGDYKSNGYNYYMTTISEFNEMMQQLYDQGYVIVSIHDVAKKVISEDGTVTFEPGDIMLPPDKKPFVISQDDVNYYAYMTGDGFASKMVLDEKGEPSTQMIMEDGSVSVGSYDMVPLLDDFIKEHPDFSYKGAKGIIALTGYEGTLGYRTNDPDSPTLKEDKETVKKLVKVMKDMGWEFASHSYGHRDMGQATYDFTVKDSDRWIREVGSLVGPTDIYIFPFGIDIETTMGHYASDKFKYLKELGFDYFCGVYKAPWIQIKEDYVRMTRRPLDGQAMLEFPERLNDLFDLSKIIDKARPELK